jgi:hypothetical protein
MKKGNLLKRYYLSLRILHPAMRAVRAIEQARIWIRAGHLDIEFYDSNTVTAQADSIAGHVRYAGEQRIRIA